MALPASDNFNRGDGGLGSNWTAIGGLGVPRIVSQQVTSQSGGTDSAAYWSADSFNADQYAECKITNGVDGGPAVRCADQQCYYLGGSSGANAIWKFVSPNWTKVGTDINITYTATDVIRLEATGTTTTTLKLYKNGSEVASRSDSSSPLTSGAAGVYAVGAHTVDDFGADNAGGTPATVNAVAATCAAAGLVPNVYRDYQVSAVIAASPAAALIPSVTTGGSISVPAEPAGASAAGLVPTVTGVMSHTFDTKARFPASGTSTSNPLTGSYTCGANASVLVVMLNYAGSAARGGGSPTYNSLPLTQADQQRYGTTGPECSSEIWYLLDPPTGSAYTLSVPNSGGLAMVAMVASALVAAGWTSFVDAASGGANVSTNPSVNLSTNYAGDIIFASVANGAQSWNPSGRTGVQLYDTDNGAWGGGSQYIIQTDAGSQTLSWTFGTSEDWGANILAFRSGKSVTINAVVASAPAAGLVPAVSIGLTVPAEIAAAPAAALVPEVTAGGVNQTVNAVVATCAASGLIPTIGTGTQNHKVDVGNGYTDVTPRQLIRTSSNRLYVSGWKFDTWPHGGIGGGNYNSQTLRMYKGNQDGIPTAFTRLDSSNEPAGVVSWAMAVDREDVIHVIWTTRATWGSPADTGVDNYVKYCQFNTATDTWGTVENLETSANVKEIGQGDELVAIAVDANSVPHVVYMKDDGTRRRVTYRNRAGGSWGSTTTVDDQSFQTGEACWHAGIAFDNSNRIVVTWLRGDNLYSSWTNNTGRLFVRVYNGSWGTTHDIAGANLWTGIDQGSPIYIDANGRYHVCYINTSKQIQYSYSDNQGGTWTANHPSSGTYVADNPSPAPATGGKVRIYSHGSSAPVNLVYWEGDGGNGSWGSATDYITDTGFDCSTNVRWSQYWSWYPSTLDVAYWKSDYPTNELYIGSEIKGTDAIIKAVAAAASAAALVPASIGAGVSVAGVAATAGAAALLPNLGASLTSTVAPASAAGLVPAISVGLTVAGITANVSAAGLVPAINLGQTVSGVVAGTGAEALVPLVTAGGSVSIPAVTAVASSSAPIPSLSTDYVIQSVTATAQAAGIGAILSLGAGVISTVAGAGAEALLPIIQTAGNVVISGVTATATAQALIITLSTGTTVAGQIATAQAASPAPTYSLSLTVLAILATAQALAQNPDISTATWTDAGTRSTWRARIRESHRAQHATAKGRRENSKADG